MATFQLITDSTADLPSGYYAQHQIVCLPYSFIVNDSVLSDVPGKTNLASYYESIRHGLLPSTTNINYDAIHSATAPFLAAGQDVAYLCFSSALSSTYQFACMCAKELEKEYPENRLYVIDTLSASMGQGLVVQKAVALQQQGLSAKALTEALPAYIQTIEHWFMVDSLDHLRRGGRISGTAAAVGKVLKIKPILHVASSGALIPIAKTNGRKKGIKYLAEVVETRAQGLPNAPIYIVHGDCLEEAKKLGEKIAHATKAKHIEYLMLGPVVGAHTGADILAVIFQGAQRTL